MGYSLKCLDTYVFDTPLDAKAFSQVVPKRTEFNGTHAPVDVPLTMVKAEGNKVLVSSGGYGVPDLTEFSEYTGIEKVVRMVQSLQSDETFFIASIYDLDDEDASGIEDEMLTCEHEWFNVLDPELDPDDFDTDESFDEATSKWEADALKEMDEAYVEAGGLLE